MQSALDAATGRQRELLDFISDYVSRWGYPPTVREIGRQFDINSPNGVMCHLKALERKGLIRRRGFSARGITVVPTGSPALLPGLDGVSVRMGAARVHMTWPQALAVLRDLVRGAVHAEADGKLNVEAASRPGLSDALAVLRGLNGSLDALGTTQRKGTGL